MRSIYKIATAPAAEPVTLTEAKIHLRLAATETAAAAYTTEDGYLSAIIAASRDWVESITGRSSITQTWDMYLSDWPRRGDFIEIGKPPLQSVTHIRYTDCDGVETTWSSSEYAVDTNSMPGRVVLGYGVDWPSFTPRPSNPINIRFVAGYGASGAAVPPSMVHAVKLLISHFYENRENSFVVGANMDIKEIPMGVMSLLSNYRECGF